MLNEQLKKQIRNEATSSAANFHYYPGSEQFEDMETAYETGAFKYAEKWQSAQQLVERYEKALIKIVSLSCKVDSRNAILELKSIASMAVAKENEAPTPKTGSDETKGASDR